jgi:hypothetical protein
MIRTAAPRAAARCAKVAVPIRHITVEEAVMGEITAVSTDLAKNVFSVHGVDAHGKSVLRKTLSCGKLIELMPQLRQCIVGMEACSGTHQLVRGKRQDVTPHPCDPTPPG